jgi:hypothetical protein
MRLRAEYFKEEMIIFIPQIKDLSNEKVSFWVAISLISSLKSEKRHGVP